MKTSSFLALIFGLITSSAFSAEAPRFLKVQQLSDATQTVFGIRLNEVTSRESNPLALDAEFSCNTVEGLLNIALCEDGTCDPYEGPFFFEFDNPTECVSAQSQLKKKMRQERSACLRLEATRSPYGGGTYDRLIVDSGAACN